MKKNILFICTDQHRADSLACYRPDTPCRTPGLDALSRQSVVFDNAYTSCPVCSPARCSMQTGLYPSKTGMESNTYQTGCRTHELQDVPYLLSRRLETLGYQMGYTGKWHLGLGKDKAASAEGQILLERMGRGFMEGGAYLGYGVLPTDIGYQGDDFPGHGGGGWWYPQFENYLKERGLKLEIINQTSNRRSGDHTFVGEVISPIESTVEYFLVDRAIALIDEMLEKDQPFFFHLNFWGPHEPFFAPTQYLDMYRDLSIPAWKSFQEDVTNAPRVYELIRRPEQPWAFFEDALRHYYACISHTDAQICRLLAHLKAKGIYDDTMVLFAADHGDNQGCHGGLENKSYSMYDDTTKIPLFIKPARAGFSGYHQEALVGTCDLYATILKEAGYEPRDAMGFGDGRPLNNFFDEPNQPWSNEIVTEGMGAFAVVVTQRMYRRENWKYVFNGADKDQLFDLSADPWEMDNLADNPAYAHRMWEMRLGLADWMLKHGDIAHDAFCKINRLKEWAI